jgi:hypothetical protein
MSVHAYSDLDDAGIIDLQLIHAMPSPAHPIPCYNLPSTGPLSRENLLSNALGNTMRQRKFQVLGEQLSNIRTLDILGFGNFDHTDDLKLARPCCPSQIEDVRAST